MPVPELDLISEPVVLGPHELVIQRPRDAEALLDEEAFEHEEFLPYWAELWPSGLALARHVAGLDLAGVRVAELGCGLALPSLAAALAGADVLATDWSPDAIELLRANAERNGIRLDVAVAGWTRPGPLLERAPFDLVLASDVLYERRNIPLLLYNLRRLGPEVLLADPRRPAAAEFLEGAAKEWDVETTELRGASRPAAPAQPNRVSSGSRSPRSTARSTRAQAIPRDSARITACGLKRCAARIPRHSARAGSSRIRSR